MALQPRQLFNSADYAAYRYDLIKQVEEGGTFNPVPYIDTAGIPTIGLGFNLRVHWELVAETMGISLTQPYDEVYRNRIRDIVNGSFQDTTAEEQRLRQELDDVMIDAVL